MQSRDQQGEKNLWFKHARAIEKKNIKTIGELVAKLKPQAGKKPFIEGVTNDDAVDMLLDIGLSALPTGPSFKEEVRKDFEGAPHKVDFKGILSSLGKMSRNRDMDVRLRNHAKEMLKFSKSNKIKDPYKENIPLSVHPATASAFRKTVIENVILALGFGERTADKLSKHFKSPGEFQESDDKDIKKITRISSKRIQKIKDALDWTRFDGVSVSLAVAFASMSIAPEETIGMSAGDLQKTIKKSTVSLPSEVTEKKHLETIASLVRNEFPETAYYYDAISSLKLPQKARSVLKSRKIKSFSDLRRNGLLEEVIEKGNIRDEELVLQLKSYLDLSTLTTDATESRQMIDAGFTSPSAIAAGSRKVFMKKMKESVDVNRLNHIYQKAEIQTRYINNKIAGIMADQANRYGTFLPSDNFDLKKCQCRDCESAVSPLAYLADLFVYTLKHVLHKSETMDLAFLTNTFNQPFTALPVTCAALDEEVLQVRLCVEVLRMYIKRQPVSAARLLLLNQAEAKYRLEAYKKLLIEIGTSFDDLRLAKGASEDKRNALALRLGLDSTDRLNEILLDTAAITEPDLATIFGLADTDPTRSDPLAPKQPPKIQIWRLNRLSASWYEQDWPNEELSDNQPVIDPDVIGTDDFRVPFHKANRSDPDRPFDIWVKRRTWIDDRLDSLAGRCDFNEMFEIMYLNISYDGTDLQPWSDNTPFTQFEDILTAINNGTDSDVKYAKHLIEDDLNLSVESFTYLMSMRTKHIRAANDPRNEQLTEQEWREVYSILIQAQKRAFYSIWRDEEDNNKVRISPEDFWISERGPSVGTWPPNVPQNQPLIDPDLLKLNDLAERTIGTVARRFWEKRKQEIINDLSEPLRTERIDHGLDSAIRMALGHPDSGDALQHDLEVLKMDLSSSDDNIVEAAKRKINDDLHLTLDEFGRLMSIKAKDEQTDQNKKPTDNEWADVIAILTRAMKLKRKYSGWFSEEHSVNIWGAMTYWQALKAKLEKWRASAGRRAEWQRILHTRSQRPLIDPDLIGPENLKNPTNGTAFDLWNKRQQDIETWQKPRIVGSSEIERFRMIIESAVRLPATELFQLAEEEKQGYYIEPRLRQLLLSRPAFNYLLRIHDLLENNEPVLSSEMEEVYSILVQVKKQYSYAQWRGDEQKKGISLSPDYFIIHEPDATVFPPPSPRPLPAWRASRTDLWDWQDTLQTRIDQKASVISSIREAVQSAEESTLPALRDALVAATGGNSSDLQQQANIMAKRLLIDTRAGGCKRTTRISQAIETIQSLLFSLRTGQLKNIYPDLELDAPDFDEEWKWIGSYPLWRAATFVFLYPDNLLYPTLRRNKTYEMKEVLESLPSYEAVSTDEFIEKVSSFSEYLNAVSELKIEAQCTALVNRNENKRRLFVFASRLDDGIYCMAYDIDSNGTVVTTALAPWTKMFDNDGGAILGVQPYFPPNESGGSGYLYIFLRTSDNRIAFRRRLITESLGADREDASNWSNPEFLDTSNWHQGDRGVILCGPVDHDTSRVPRLVALLPRILGTDDTVSNSNALYEISLHRDGNRWAGQAFKDNLKPAALLRESPFYGTAWESVLQYDYKKDTIYAHADGYIEFTLEKPEKNFEIPGEDNQDKINLWVRKGSSDATRDNCDLALATFSRTLTDKGTVDVKKGDEINLTVYGYERWHYRYSLDIRFKVKAVGFPTTPETFYLEDVVATGDHFSSFKIVTRDHDSSISRYRIWREINLRLDSFKETDRLERFDLLAMTSADNYLRSLRLEDGNIAIFWEQNGLPRSRVINANADQFITGILQSSTGPTAVIRKWNKDNILAMKKPNNLADLLSPGQANEWALNLIGDYAGAWYSEQEYDVIKPAYFFSVTLPNNLPAMDLTNPTVHNARREFFADLQSRAPIWRTYAEEATWFLPIWQALNLQRAGQYLAALDWFRTVYDYIAPVEVRKVYPGLAIEEEISTAYERPDEWLIDPLDPHAMARTRANAYTRYTLFSIIRCLLDYADTEFTRDTAESLSRARMFYSTALELLDSPELQQKSDDCDETIGALTIDVGDLQWNEVWGRIRSEVSRINEPGKKRNVFEATRNIMKKDVPLSERIDSILNLLSQEDQAEATMVSFIKGRLDRSEEMQREFLEHEMDNIPLVYNTLPQSFPYFPNVQPGYDFCVPPNPLLDALRMRAEVTLFKLRTCRNIAGMKREVQPYEGPTDTVSGLPTIGAGGQLVLPGTASFPPSQYRYKVLIDHARRLAGIARQMETDMLSALEKRSRGQYDILTARQNVQLTREGIRLQDFRVTEAESGRELANLQQQSTQIRLDHYSGLMEAGNNFWEDMSLELSKYLSMAYTAAAEYGGVGIIFGGPQVAMKAAELAAQATAQWISYANQMASYERRMQEWMFQKELAVQDIEIGNLQKQLAEDHVRVIGQERTIARLQSQNASEIVEFLNEKFDNIELYDWMSNILMQVYAYFLQQATAIAKIASNQLAFERQQPPPQFIQSDYWEVSRDVSSDNLEEDETDRKGLTGSIRLQKDIEKLDQYAFKTDERKLNLVKRISLSQLSPVEFQRFRETGILLFHTPMELFDRDFPGHYLRLISKVSTTIIALIPPTEGIRATLTANRISRVVIGGDIFQTAQIQRGPDQVALTSPSNATGVFELDPHPEMLRPFEGIGVDTGWEFRLPKASNHFDFSTIADVIVTIEYTALNSFTYRQQVIQQLPPVFYGDRYFSFRYQLPDLWYELHNSERSDSPMLVRFSTQREDFPSNLDGIKIKHVVLYFSRKSDTTFEVPVEHLHFSAPGSDAHTGGGAETIDGVISTRRGNAGSWTTMIGKAPIGDWELKLPDTPETRKLFKDENIEDILLVISYSGRTPEWPS